MADTSERKGLPQWLAIAGRVVGPVDVLGLIPKLVEVWKALDHLLGELRYRGMYEILDYDATLEIADIRGEKAKLTRREHIRFLQDNVVAIHDHAWGDGRFLCNYQCQPGVPVDIYEDGSKHNILISLRETKNKGDEMELWVERTIRGGFTEDEEWLETEVDHLMRRLKLAVIFPQGRPCRRATLTRRSTGKVTPLPQSHFALLPDGRGKLTWETRRPRLHDRYTIKWAW